MSVRVAKRYLAGGYDEGTKDELRDVAHEWLSKKYTLLKAAKDIIKRGDFKRGVSDFYKDYVRQTKRSHPAGVLSESDFLEFVEDSIYWRNADHEDNIDMEDWN